MFQYAVARQLAERHNTELRLDTSGFANYELYGFGLANFNISADIATADDLSRFKAARKSARGMRRLFSAFSHRPERYVRESSLRFNHQILALPDQVYLDGYWQSEQYFVSIRPLLLQEFSLKAAPTAGFLRLADQIRARRAVSIHIRRGDYVADQTTQQVHGVCSLEYYQQAVRELASHFDQLEFYVFSDDITWAEANLRLPHPMVFMGQAQQLKNYEELLLMSLCRHNIIANSTFSWWGAWLNQHPDKRVIAPAKWFNDPEKDASDLVPVAWNRI